MRAYQTIALVVFLFLGASWSAHEGDLNENNCHDVTTVNEEGENEVMCHCHDTNRVNVELACEAGEPKHAVKSLYEIRIEEEEECTDYEGDHYSYGRYLDIIKALQQGGYYAAYENRCYDGPRDVTIEHIVARHEAHVSGLCSADYQTKVDFANDLDNIALADGDVNSEKSNSDPAEWLPDHHQCWFVSQTLRVKKKWNLSVDKKELEAINEVLSNCTFEETYLAIPEDCTLVTEDPDE